MSCFVAASQEEFGRMSILGLGVSSEVSMSNENIDKTECRNNTNAIGNGRGRIVGSVRIQSEPVFHPAAGSQSPANTSDSEPSLSACRDTIQLCTPVQDVNFSDLISSAGSRSHACGCCQPCAYQHRPEGCTKGALCRYCHLCPKDEIKKRQKAKMALKKNIAKLTGLSIDGRVSCLSSLVFSAEKLQVIVDTLQNNMDILIRTRMREDDFECTDVYTHHEATTGTPYTIETHPRCAAVQYEAHDRRMEAAGPEELMGSRAEEKLQMGRESYAGVGVLSKAAPTTHRTGCGSEGSNNGSSTGISGQFQNGKGDHTQAVLFLQTVLSLIVDNSLKCMRNMHNYDNNAKRIWNVHDTILKTITIGRDSCEVRSSRPSVNSKLIKIPSFSVPSSISGSLRESEWHPIPVSRSLDWQSDWHHGHAVSSMSPDSNQQVKSSFAGTAKSSVTTNDGNWIHNSMTTTDGNWIDSSMTTNDGNWIDNCDGMSGNFVPVGNSIKGEDRLLEKIDMLEKMVNTLSTAMMSFSVKLQTVSQRPSFCPSDSGAKETGLATENGSRDLDATADQGNLCMPTVPQQDTDWHQQNQIGEQQRIPPHMQNIVASPMTPQSAAIPSVATRRVSRGSYLSPLRETLLQPPQFASFGAAPRFSALDQRSSCFSEAQIKQSASGMENITRPASPMVVGGNPIVAGVDVQGDVWSGTQMPFMPMPELVTPFPCMSLPFFGSGGVGVSEIGPSEWLMQ